MGDEWVEQVLAFLVITCVLALIWKYQEKIAHFADGKPLSDFNSKSSDETESHYPQTKFSPEPQYTCPCCGYITLIEEPPGNHEICGVCWWEDDGVQFRDPDYRGGANGLSLREYQAAFLEGRLEPPDISDAPDDIREELERTDYKHDPSWKPLPQKG